MKLQGFYPVFLVLMLFPFLSSWFGRYVICPLFQFQSRHALHMWGMGEHVDGPDGKKFIGGLFSSGKAGKIARKRGRIARIQE